MIESILDLNFNCGDYAYLSIIKNDKSSMIRVKILDFVFSKNEKMYVISGDSKDLEEEKSTFIDNFYELNENEVCLYVYPDELWVYERPKLKLVVDNTKK